MPMQPSRNTARRPAFPRIWSGRRGSDADPQQRQQQQDQAAKQQQMQQAAETANTHANTAQTLSQTPTQGGPSNALDQLCASVGGGQGP